MIEPDELTAQVLPVRSLLNLPTWADRRRTFERDHQIAARLDGQHQDEPLPHTIRYVVGNNRVDITLDDGATSSLWWATKNEWLGVLDVAGLELQG